MMRMICVVCGKATPKPQGMIRHPCCCECWKTRKQLWLNSLRFCHPLDYADYVEYEEATR